MKKYIKPSNKTVVLEAYTLLSGSIGMGVSDTPATGPANGKEMQLFDDDLWEERTF